ncbi:uncharacterized protein LOC132470405 isoform X1 [Gadus macrocephalus]|uniref:uncharacterized protein LOC132470405 isoform X1 n=1 Tax=Gadus macrocephalus TaxID=80720 RepID=UPI0028CB637B|nr:uncharacterized protein LOC132470405 isoform X1 [Gadus macrocephalus]
MDKRSEKARAGFFSSGEQKLLIEVYEDYKHIITQKGNTIIINKNRDAAWQVIADRLNASGLGNDKRTWIQVKTKHKNILQSATKKKSDSLKTGGGNPPKGLTPAEDLALALNRGRPLKQELVDPPQEDVFGQQEVEQMFTLDEPDEEASSAVTDVSDSIPETRRAAGQNEDVKAIYKRHLLLDNEYKRLKMRKVQLEIKKLEKEDANSGRPHHNTAALGHSRN